MKHYVVRIEETLARTVVVAAENASDAEKKVEAAYNEGVFCIDVDDYDGYDISALREAKENELSYYDVLEDD